MRPVVRCRKCRLNQYLTKSGKCRKCGNSLVIEIPTIRPKPLSLGVSNLQARISLAIRFIRQLKKLSQRELAERIGVPRTLVNRWENGVCLPTLPSLHRIATAMRVSTRLIVEVAESIDLVQEESTSREVKGNGSFKE